MWSGKAFLEGRAFTVCERGADGAVCQCSLSKPRQQSAERKHVTWPRQQSAVRKHVAWPRQQSAERKHVAWPRQSSCRDLALAHSLRPRRCSPWPLAPHWVARRGSPSSLLSAPLRGRRWHSRVSQMRRRWPGELCRLTQLTWLAWDGQEHGRGGSHSLPLFPAAPLSKEGAYCRSSPQSSRALRGQRWGRRECWSQSDV